MSYDTITQKFAGQAAVGVTCWCSIEFAIPRTLYDFYRRRNEEKPGSFALRCPLGHEFIPAAKTAAQREADRLRDELAREKHRAEQAQADAQRARGRAEVYARQVAARKGQLTRIKNRVGNGVCPCCNRYFANLHRHMVGQHPDWNPAENESTPGAKQAPTPMTIATPWGKMAAQRRVLGIALATAAHAIGLKASSLRAYEAGSLGSKSAAARYADYLNRAALAAVPAGGASR